jgi:hypothetical protein
MKAPTRTRALLLGVSGAIFVGGYALAAGLPARSLHPRPEGQVAVPAKASPAAEAVAEFASGDARRLESSSASPASFTDPSGDNPGNAPDITDVTVSANDASTIYTFQIGMPNYTGLAAGIFIDVYIDSDESGKADYLIRVNGDTNQIEIDYWNGSTWAAFTASTLQGTAAFPEVIGVGRSDLGNTAGFWFWTRAWKYIAGSSPACCYDGAPDGGVWEYRLSNGSGTTTATGGTTTTPGGTTTAPGGTTTARRAPPPPRPGGAPEGQRPPGVPKQGNAGSVPTSPANPSNPSAPAPSARAAKSAPKSRVKLDVETFTMSPPRPRAGRITAKMFVVRDDTGVRIPAGIVGCTAAIRKAQLRPLVHRFVRGAVTCVWLLPRGSRGARLVGSVRVSYGGSNVRKPFRLVVK